MNCIQCKNKLRSKRIIFDYSEKCGIAGVTIHSARKYMCKACDAFFIDLGSVDEINNEICKALICVEIITRQQLRFLRAEVYVENYFEFAKRLSVHPQYLRDLEEFRKPISKDFSDEIKLVIGLRLIAKPISIVMG